MRKCHAFVIAGAVGLCMGIGSISALAQSSGARPGGSVLSAMPGEWGGSIQVREGSMVSGSIASLSAREEKGGSVSLVFDGYVHCKPVEGAARIACDRGGAHLRLADSLSGGTWVEDCAGGASGSMSFVVEGAARVRHVVRLDGEKLVIERFVRDEKGNETLEVAMTFTRLGEGCRSSAAALRDSSVYVARVESPGAATAAAKSD